MIGASRVGCNPIPRDAPGDATEGQRPRLLLVNRHRQTLATLGAAALEHLTARFGLHALAESMLAGTLQIAGLKSTFRHSFARRVFSPFAARDRDTSPPTYLRGLKPLFCLSTST